MDLRSRAVFRASVGFAAGMIIGTVLTAVLVTLDIKDGILHICVPAFTAMMGGNELAAFTVQAIVSGLYGAIGLGGSVVYYIESWSILRATVTHFIFTVSAYYATGLSLKWFSSENFSELLFMFFFFVAVYIVIWMSNYLYYRAQVNEINRELTEWKTKGQVQSL